MTDDARARTEIRRTEPDLLRRAGSFALPVGPRLAPGTVSGYGIDLRAKVEGPEWPPGWMVLGGGETADGSVARVGGVMAQRLIYVHHVQWGLGCFERYLAGDGEVWLAGALGTGRYLVASQERRGRYDGGWVHRFAFPHTYPLRKPWVSAMAQGEGASLLVRLYGVTEEQEFAEAALRALRPLRVAVADGGARASLGGGPFLEEYPTEPPSFVLNGAFFALWGLHDVGVALDDEQAASEFQEGVDVLASELHRWDTGYWSRYDLFPHRVANVANPFYHRLHINLLRAMRVLAPRAQFDETIERFEAYGRSSRNVRRAYAHKLLFRVLSPRRAALRRVLPWASALHA
jgi:heparosan-N-sulfate-glucuronate 5-epimerase